LESAFKKWTLIPLILWPLWLGATMAVDFLAIPSVFSVSDDMYEAGRVGLLVFGNFNKVEIVLGLLSLLLGLYLMRKKEKRSKLFLGLGLLLFTIPLVYTFQFTPKISYYAQEMERLGKVGSQEADNEHEVMAENHFFYHSWYIRTDGLKMALLLGGIALTGFAHGKRKELNFNQS
jgi:hypothetical protein